MQSSTVWFTAIFVIALLAAFIFGTSAIFRQLKADKPAPLQQTTNLTPWLEPYPILP